MRLDRHVVIWATVSAALLAACSSSAGPAGTSSHVKPSSSPTVAPVAPADLAGRCQGSPPGANGITFAAGDGARLSGAILGGGSIGIVIANDVPHEICEELDEATFLARHGYRVLVFDYRGHGDSAGGDDPGALDQDVVGAAHELRRRGARTVFLFGTYGGGAISVVASTETRVRGVVAISPAARMGQFVNGPYSGPSALGVAPQVRVPVLYVTVRTDGYVPLAEARRLFQRTNTRHRYLVVIPTGGGGWDLFNLSAYTDRANRTILRFLADPDADPAESSAPQR